MKASHRLAVAIAVAVLIGSCSDRTASEPEAPSPVASTPDPCAASSSWVTAPDPPSEIGNGTPVDDQTNCQFYQFGWQWFLALASPVDGGTERGFEALRVFQPGQTDQCAANPARGVEAMKQSLSVRIAKDDDDNPEHVVPAELGQASGQALYDQERNVVLYTIGYSDNECAATSEAGYEPNTIENKLSWRVMDPADPELGTYYTMTDVVVPEFSNDPVTLGLVGFHLVINTATHPEFVWLTWEHKSNAPDCTDPQAAPAGGWSFTSACCANQLADASVTCEGGCDFNTGVSCGGDNPCQVSGDPNEICLVYPWGTDPGSETNGNDNDTNRFNIVTLNDQLVGPGGIVTTLPATDPMAVWKNYQNIGGLWTNGGVSSGGTDVQRGSLQLANTTMESFVQDGKTNCFSCHRYDSTTPLTVSHIINDLLPSSD